MSAPWKVPREERWRQPKAPRALRRKELREQLSERLAAAMSPADTTIDVTTGGLELPGLTEQALRAFMDEMMRPWVSPPPRNIVYISAWPPEEWNPGPRADGFDPDDAWLLCGACNEEWWFDPVPYGQYAVAPCGHFFLEHMTDIVAAFAGHVKPKGKANYRIVTEPPQ